MSHAKGKNSGDKRGAASTNSWGGWFVRCDITEEHKAHLQKQVIDYDRLAEWEAGVIERGFKLSVSFKAETGAFVASLTGTQEGTPHYKGTLSSFAPTYWLAKLTLSWKHEELLGGIWTNNTDLDIKWG